MASSDPTGILGAVGKGAPVDTSLSPAEQAKAKLKKASQDFEAVFVGMMLKQMRHSVGGDGNALFGNSPQAKLYQDMMDDAVAKAISTTGAFGFGKAIYKSLEKTLPREALTPDPSPTGAASSAPTSTSLGRGEPERESSLAGHTGADRKVGSAPSIAAAGRATARTRR